MVRVWFGTILLTEFCASVNCCQLVSPLPIFVFLYFLATLAFYFVTNTINKLVNSLTKWAITLTKLPTRKN